MSIDPARRTWPSLIVFVLLTLAAASFGAMFHPGGWYEQLAKPSWNPPNWIFAPVWSVLYIAIAVAGWRVWQRKANATGALAVWGGQLVLNALWSFLFFGLHRPDIALVDILLLLGMILAFIWAARAASGLASVLFIPYAIWVAFASSLNAAIWLLN